VAVRLAARDGRLALEVADDGAGFSPEDPQLRSRRLGLTSMEERAQRLGGRLEIRSAPGAGTTVRLEVDRG
jgi:signal transduction histidine kinase